ncbi:6-phosphogluconolactonase isoform 2-T2 [Pholidichthys leucotaenia]
MAARRVVVFPSSAELGPALAHLVTSRADSAISTHGRFTLGLSGGSLVSMLSKELLALPQLDCSKWVVGFCDERLVSFDDPDSTYGLYKNQLFSKVNIPESRILTIDSSLPVNECAEDYTCKLKEETKKIVAPISDSPKPPPQRVTMTFPVVNSARCVAFVSTGRSKAPVLKEVLEGREGPAFPAARVVPTKGELFWLVDDPAAASLTIQVERLGSGAKL